MDDVKKHRKMDKGKGRVSSRDESQSSSRKRPPPGRKMSDDQQTAAKKQKCTYCFQNMCIYLLDVLSNTYTKNYNTVQHCMHVLCARVSYMQEFEVKGEIRKVTS